MAIPKEFSVNGYELVASIIQSVASLAWPLAFLGAVCLFRRELSSLLPLLRLKYKDVEASFRLDQAEQEAASMPNGEALPETEPTPEEVDKFEQVAKLSPRAAILEVRSDIEEAVRSLAEAVNLLTPRVQSMLGLTRLLRKSDIIEASTSALLDDLRVIGNNAAHRPEAGFSTDDALRYRALANQAIAQLRRTEAKQR